MEGDLTSVSLREALDVYATRTAIIEATTGDETTYRELEYLAAGLDAALGKSNGRVLVIFIPKSALFYAAIVRCLVLSLPFCCLDENTPPARVRDVCGRFEEPVLLCDAVDEGVHFAGIDCVSSLSVVPVQHSLRATLDDGESHYFIATSGSTGVPKLIQGRQRPLGVFAAWSVPFYGVDVSTRWSQFSGTGFDLTLVDIVTVLSAGGALVALASTFDRMVPTRAIREFKVTHWHSVPSMIPSLLAHRRDGDAHTPSLFTFCGEPLFRESVLGLRELFPRARIVNTYGPTEGTLFCMAHEVGDKDLQNPTMPLGKPIPGWDILLKPQVAPAEFECVLVSDFLAEGYWQGEVGGFGTCTLDGRSRRSYQTGDIVELKHDQLFFARRTDSMVKVNGARMDLAELEGVARMNGAANPVAFLAAGRLVLVFEESPNGPSVDDLDASFLDALPPWGRPTSVTKMTALPRSASGKIDRSKTQTDWGSSHAQG